MAAALQLALGHHQSGRLAEAEILYRKILAVEPAQADALHLLGVIAKHHGQLDEAIAYYRRALALKPDFAAVHGNLGNALRDRGDQEAALACYREALALDPDFAEARWCLALAQVPAVHAPHQDPQACREAFARELDALPEWFRVRDVMVGFRAVGTLQPFNLAYREENNRELLGRYGALVCQLMARWQALQGYRPADLQATGRIRVGIVSQHIRSHSVWHALVKGWVRHLDRSRIDLHVFCLNATHDAETALAQEDGLTFVTGPVSPAGWAEAILAHRIEVLIYPEVGMDPLTVKLASLRLAPVQMAAWGHPETTGLPTIDHYLSAEDLEGDDAQACYTEHLVKLPHLGCSYQAAAIRPVAPDWAQLGLDPQTPLLLCPGSPYKYAPTHDRVWVEIAKRTGNSRLVFFTPVRQASLAERLRQRLADAFAQGGLIFDDHAVFIPWLDAPRFYGLMQHATAFLDTIGFSGFNTAMQAMECGLPVVTREGRFMRGRLASGILRRMGLPELVTNSEEDYVALAVRLVADGEYRASLQQRIVALRPQLFGDLAPIRALEEVLTGLCRPATPGSARAAAGA